MKSLQTGSGPVSGRAGAIADELLINYPGDVWLLTGLVLADPYTGWNMAVDLVIITEAAVLVGLDAARDLAPTETPRAAAQLVAQIQRAASEGPALPVFAAWLGDAVPTGQPDDSAPLPDAAAAEQFIARAIAGRPVPPGDVASSLVTHLLQSDGVSARQQSVNGQEDPSGRKDPPSPAGFRRILRDLVRLPGRVENTLEEGIRAPLFVRRRRPIQPPDVSRQLEKAMLTRENHLEDVNYGLIVPNDYLVELNREHYERHFRPIEKQVSDQWRDRLLDVLSTTNSRYGGTKYRFGGRVRVRIKPASDLAGNEVRIRSHINADVAPTQAAPLKACLELLPGGQRYMLREGIVTMGRDPACDIYLNLPAVLEKRLVSGQHAYLRCEGGRCRVHDGQPGGKASVNGTFLNGRPVPQSGLDLHDGDLIVLAALDPARPRPDTPGVAGFVFRTDCTR